MTRWINSAGLDVITKNEGLKLTAYRDVAGVWTIGYGHTPAQEGQTISQFDALGLLQGDLVRFEAGVDMATHDVPTTDNQFSAMVSLAYNIGLGAFKTSSVLRCHRHALYGVASSAFLMWDKAHEDGVLVTVPGLERRREEESALYLGGPAAVVAG